MPGMRRTLGVRRIQLDSSGQMLGDCTTCMAMSGNGCKIGMQRILRRQSQIHKVLVQAQAGYDEAGVGSVPRGTAAQRIVTSPSPVTASTAWAFACSGQSRSSLLPRV